jgi:hypothetical protein
MRFLRPLAALLMALLLVPLASAATVRPDQPTVTYTMGSVAANNTDLIKVECLEARQLEVQLTGTWTATVSFQGSNDDTTYSSIQAFPIGGGATVTSATAVGQWVIPVTAQWIRVRVTAYTSGTATGIAVARDRPTDIPTSQISLAANQSVNVAQINGVTPLMGNGTTGTGSHRVTIASDNTAFTVNLGTGGTSGTSIGKARDSAIGATDTGVAILAVRRDVPTAETPAAGDYIVPQYSSLGEQWVKDIGAGTTHHLISAATTNATSVKASAGTVNHIVVSNVNAAVRYFKLYNKASAPTVGTDTPVLTLAIPPASVQSIVLGTRGLRLSTGIAYALTTGIAVADTGAVAASEHAVHISYE